MKKIALINHDAERLWDISKTLSKKAHDVLSIVDLEDACLLLPVFDPHVILYDHGSSEKLIEIFNFIYLHNKDLILLITGRVKRLDNLKVPYIFSILHIPLAPSSLISNNRLVSLFLKNIFVPLESWAGKITLLIMKKIMLLEDDQSNIDVVQILLENIYSLRVVRHKNYIQEIRAFNPHLILLDVFIDDVGDGRVNLS